MTTVWEATGYTTFRVPLNGFGSLPSRPVNHVSHNSYLLSRRDQHPIRLPSFQTLNFGAGGYDSREADSSGRSYTSLWREAMTAADKSQ